MGPSSTTKLRDVIAGKEVGRLHLLFGFGNAVLREDQLLLCEEQRENLFSSWYFDMLLNSGFTVVVGGDFRWHSSASVLDRAYYRGRLVPISPATSGGP